MIERKIEILSQVQHIMSKTAYLTDDKSVKPIQESAIQDLQKSVHTIQQDIKTIKNDMRNLLHKLDDKEWEGYGEPEELVEMSVDEIKELILTRMDKSKPFYPSDVADDYNLDYNAVTEAVEELLREGHLKE